MGAGKTSAAINYMNKHTWKKFIYVAPYLDETARIKEACKKIKFVEPSDSFGPYHTKSAHALALIQEGRNITTTHSLFQRFTDEMVQEVRKQHYVLIVDESLTAMDKRDVTQEDIEVAEAAGFVTFENGMYKRTDKQYNGEWKGLRDLLEFMEIRDLAQVIDKLGVHIYYWALPPSLLLAFDDVFILTYMFTGQGLYYYLKMQDIDFRYIGVDMKKSGKYEFGEYPGRMPDYVRELKDKIHIIDHKKLNLLGKGRYALSKHWYSTREDKEKDRVSKNIYNYFHNIAKGSTSSNRMIGGYEETRKYVNNAGYSKSFTMFNLRATNDYRDKQYLAYLANPFMNVGIRQFFNSHGVKPDQDAYALSILVQWIWRSAIRDGGEITIYLPSERMRKLLTKWIESLESKEVAA